MSGPAHNRPYHRLNFLREVGWSAAVLIATVAAMAGLTALSWFTISATSHASAQVRSSSVAADAYVEMQDALELTASAEHAFALDPAGRPARDQLAHSTGALDRALAGLSASANARNVPATAPERKAIAALAAGDGAIDAAIQRVAAAAGSQNAYNVSRSDATRFTPVLQRMLRITERQTRLHQDAAARRLAASQATDRRASLVVVITGLLCVALTWTVVRMLRLRRRLADVHGREIARLSDAALRDSLTGLRNHRCFQEDIRRSLESDSALHALLVDMDGLKGVNDRLGHHIGDERIRLLADALAAACSGTHADAYRIGGDEFAIIAAGRVSRPERIAEAVHAELQRRGGLVTATIGIATAAPGMPADELLRRADKALIVGKPTRAGTHNYSRALESAPTSTEAERAELLAIIDDPAAIASVFQPIVDLHSGEVLGHEALSRFPAADWRNPQEWFDLAHAHDLSIELEAAAVRAALEAPGRPALPHLNLNISPKVLLSARDRIGLPDDLSAITIEVTEDELVTEGPDLELALRDLRARGARIAIDDAGAGYAGFAQVVRVRPDVIKLDRSVVEGVDTEPLKEAVVKAFVQFAESARAVVCAEGIETAAELRTLTALGVDAGQGYLLGRPTATGMVGPAPVLALGRAPGEAAAANVVPLRRTATA